MTQEHREIRLPQPLRVFLWVTATLTAVCVAVELWCARVLQMDYPYTWPLMPPDAPYLDFALYQDRFAFFHSPAFFTFGGPDYYYPAPMAVVHWLFFQLPHPLAIYLDLLRLAFAVAIFLAGRLLLSRGLSLRAIVPFLLVTATCSYPFFFEFEQANLEWVVCVLVATGIWAFLRSRGYAAAVCFGLAGSMKLFPFVLLGLLLSRRQYRQIATAAVVATLTTLVSLCLECPDVATAWHGTQIGLAKFRVWYVLRFEQVGFDHSLFATLKAMWSLHSQTPLDTKTLAVVSGLYLPVVAFAGIVLYFDRIRKLPVVNQVICLCVASILLPPVSYDYTLIHLFMPWMLLVLVAVESRGRAVAGLVGALVCFAIVFAPETEVIWNEQTYGGQIKAVALVSLFVIALRRGFPSSFDPQAWVSPVRSSSAHGNL